MLKETWGEIWNGYLKVAIRSVQTYVIIKYCVLNPSKSNHFIFCFSFCNCITCLLSFDLKNDLIFNIIISRVSCFQYTFRVDDFRLQMSTQIPSTLRFFFKNSLWWQIKNATTAIAVFSVEWHTYCHRTLCSPTYTAGAPCKTTHEWIEKFPAPHKLTRKAVDML